MARLPDNYDVAAGFVPARPGSVFTHLCKLEHWPEVFSGWITSIESDDERSAAVGPARERYDLYAQIDADALQLDVEVIDELGSADMLRLRVLDMPGGALVLIAHGRLAGTSDAAWQQKRDGIAQGLLALSLD